MESRVAHGARVRNVVVTVLFGHVGGALLAALLGAVADPYLAYLGAFVGAATLGWAGIALGVAVALLGAPTDDAGEPPVLRPWLSIGGGVVASVLVVTTSLAATAQRGFLDGSPCENQGRGLDYRVVDTLIPAQYSCVYDDGALALVHPDVLALVSVLAVAGAAAIAWGLWALRSAPDETRVRWLAASVALFLVVDGVLGAVALIAPAALAATGS